MSELPSGTVTFLFTDIEGSTRLLKLLGSRYAETLAEHQRLLRAAFAEHGGREIDTQGDSFFVAFPRARDAALAAAGAQRALAAQSWPDEVELRVRIGLHTGEPSVGEERYVGLGVHRAARIMAAGHGGQVLLSQATRAVLADETLPGIAIRDLGEYRLKDLDEPERLYQLGGGEFPPLRAPREGAPRRLLPEGQTPLPGPLVPASPFPFVGRSGEMARLRSLLERAAAGEGGLVLLAAEAGGGKTRLIREFAHASAAGGVLVCYGASDAAVSTPYQPLLEWLAFLLRVADPDALRQCLGDRAAELTRVVPELSRLTGRPSDAGEVDRYSLHGAVAEFLTELSRVQPLLLVADDVHWADGETLQLLRRLARSAPETRMLVLAAYRSEESGGELGDTLADLSRQDGVTQLAPAHLGDDDVSEFIRASADADATAELVSAVGELTDGTPLLLCELWRDLRETGAVDVAATIRLTRPVAELRGSARLAGVVQQRLSRLAPNTVALLELAAVAGARFELRVVGDAAGLESRALVDAVEEATDSGLIEELPDPVPACRFSHELVRRAVYDRLKRLRRAELHREVGEALERAHAADPSGVLPELAYHFTLAAPLAGVERGVDYNLRAADAALGAAAYREAAARMSAALELGIADGRERARVQIKLAHIHRNAGQWREAEALVAASLATAAALGESDVDVRARVTRAWMELWDPVTDVDESRAVAQEAITALTESDDALGLAEAWRLLAFTYRRQCRESETGAAYEHALLHAEVAGDADMYRMSRSGLASSIADGPIPAGESIRRCEEIIRAKPGDPMLEAVITRYLSPLVAMTGRFEEALELVERSSRIIDASDHVGAWASRDRVAETRELAGDPVGAQRELEARWRAIDDYRSGALDARAMDSASLLALLYCDDGLWGDAERWLEYGRDVPLPPYCTRHSVFCLAARARLAAHRGELEEALPLARRAVEVAEQSDMPNFRARAWLALAEVERAAGHEAEANAAVAAALALYEQKGNVASAARLRALSHSAT